MADPRRVVRPACALPGCDVPVKRASATFCGRTCAAKGIYRPGSANMPGRTHCKSGRHVLPDGKGRCAHCSREADTIRRRAARLRDGRPAPARKPARTAEPSKPAAAGNPFLAGGPPDRSWLIALGWPETPRMRA